MIPDHGDGGELHEPTCPGLVPTVEWDSPEALRGPILAMDRLREHGEELARCHGAPSSHVTPGPLRKRMARARLRIREHYDALGRSSARVRDPSPSEQWLLDNAHIVEDQLREVEEDLPWGYLVELPRLSHGAMRGYPRVYGLCLDYLRHTDTRVDLDSLAQFVLAYERQSPLTIGELWAIPIMLRLGLILVVGALADSEGSAQDRGRADELAARLDDSGTDEARARALLSSLAGAGPPSAAFLVQLVRRLREHDHEPPLVTEWIRATCAKVGTTPDELTRRYHLHQAADQVSVGNAITSMRAIASLDWNDFFQRTSVVEALLEGDPAGAYRLMDAASRDRCRHEVEGLARRSNAGERQVAEIALELAAAHARTFGASHGAAHVGHYLVGEGRRELEKRTGYRRTLGEWVKRLVTGHATLLYFGSLAMGTLALSVTLLGSLGTPQGGTAWLLLPFLALVTSEITLTLLNALLLALVPPRMLPKLDFESGIPTEHRTLVVVPALLESAATIDRLLEELEVRALANHDANLRFALLTDFEDAPSPEVETDAALLERAERGIQGLNERHPGPVDQGPKFGLLHRRRRPNPVEGCFMGWERKRGKLEELNRLLRHREEEASFQVVTFPRVILESIRYVITLDADTELPRDVARKLIGTLAHPSNRPEFEESGRRVIRGHGIIQPRVGALPKSSRRSRFARLFAGPSGIDPYTTAVSDVYQDLFGEASYVGKGIYDVDAFVRALSARVPENHLLSHDLFEGNFARAGLATDIEVLDEQPGAYRVEVARQHRWLRGDWQLLPWLFPRVPSATGDRVKNDLSALGWWKIFDNLRRSLVAPAAVALLVLGWVVGNGAMTLALLALALLFGAPVVTRLLLDLARSATGSSRRLFGSLGGDLGTNTAQALLGAVFLLDRALLCVDGIARGFYRTYISKKHRLEWTTMRKSEGDAASRSYRLPGGALLAALGLVAVALSHSGMPVAVLSCSMLILAMWCLAPGVASWLDRPASVEPGTELSPADRRQLRLVARKTWRFFDTFVGEQDNFLPPDNYQEDPCSVVAHRTSPTNIGLYLLSVVAARDLGFVTTRHAIDSIGRTLDTLESLTKREGHVLNWYDTETLKPLEPVYVSTVDSGNLAAYLCTLAGACEELADMEVRGPESRDAIEDALELARRSLRENRDDDAHYWLSQASLTEQAWSEEAGTLLPFTTLSDPPLDAAVDAAVGDEGDELTCLRERLAEAVTPRGVVAVALDVSASLDDLLGQLPDRAELDTPREAIIRQRIATLSSAVERASGACGQLIAEAERLAARARALMLAMNFRFLFDEQRELFSIGYNADSGRLDPSHYDLLASEARLASFLAIAKGEVTQDHWFRLARPRTGAAHKRALLSWSGSMFEYLMPLLVTRTLAGTLLDETYDAVVTCQIAYGRERRIPWGISESAYNVMDLALTYQYRAFGVPGLGFKPGLREHLVIAPYATALAAMVRPDAATRNLSALTRAGLEGAYGYYEAADYTPAHVPPGKKSVIVKAYMAHHQGMTLVALDNVLRGGPMQRRFHADARMRATELLLEERVPSRDPIISARSTASLAPPPPDSDMDAVEHLGLSSSVPRFHLLGHGQLSTLVGSLGSGMLSFKGLDVNRFREDRSVEAGGIYAYVRNHTDSRTWSAGYLPTRAPPDSYSVAFSTDRVEIHRRDGAIETLTEVVVSPEHLAEVRRFTLVNHGKRPRTLDVTTYTELSLSRRAADVAHRAFEGLFVEAEALVEKGAVLARRRPRSTQEPGTWVGQVLSSPSEEMGSLEVELSRSRFLGRLGNVEAPALQAPGATLSSTEGVPLDPAFVLRRSVTIAPGQRISFALTTVLSESRQGILDLIEHYTSPRSITRAFELAWADSRVELKHLAITAAEAHVFQRLLSVTLFPVLPLRAGGADAGNAREALWRQGISGDRPIVLVRVDDASFADLCRAVVLAQEFFRLNGVDIDVLFLNEEPSGYVQPTHDALGDLLRSSPARGRMDQNGGVFLRRADQVDPGDRALLTGSARVVLQASKGSLTRQLKRAAEALTARAGALLPKPKPSGVVPRPAVQATRARTDEAAAALSFWNGLGGFSADGREYVIRLEPGAATPAPWCNVLANPRFGSVVSEAGASFTFAENSQRHRLTPWSNDATCDPSGELVYLRDDADGTTWSATPSPSGRDVAFEVRHGWGYTRFRHQRGHLVQELTEFVAATDPVKVFQVSLRNDGSEPRRLSLFILVEWVLGQHREGHRTTVCTTWREAEGVLLARNPGGTSPGRVAFLRSTRPVRSFTCDREDFFGVPGTRAHPRALEHPELSGRSGLGLDPCGALHVTVELGPGERTTIAFVLGEGENLEHALELARSYAREADGERALSEVERTWSTRLGAVQISTPDHALDLMLNGWLLYQATACRLFARSGFYQSSGAYGFRDQLQDVLGLLHSEPGLAREHLLRAAARQFPEGDVQHWWHPDSGEGVRTRCSDDMAWLPCAVAAYLRVTGDAGVLHERCSFLLERELKPTEHDLFSAPPPSAEAAPLYDHCTRALDKALSYGPRDLPRIQGGDWNDGMNRVGEEGRGESIWLAWFLIRTLSDFIDVAEAWGDEHRVSWCRQHVARLTRAVESHGWDGAWYRRAYFDDGTPLGSASGTECRIDAIAQSWATIAGTGSARRAAEALRSAEAHLVREDSMLLLTPPFENADPDPGYIRAYPPGLRENGGQYTHGVLWMVQALAMSGEGDRAGRLLAALNPVRHTHRPELLERYKVEPYVVAADVYSAPGHEGRGGWTWYTGAAAWMYRITLEHVLGVSREGSSLRISPCVPKHWPRFEVTYRHPGGTLVIQVRNPEGFSTGVREMKMNGHPLAPDEPLRLPTDGKAHVVSVTLGTRDAGTTGDDPPGRPLVLAAASPSVDDVP